MKFSITLMALFLPVFVNAQSSSSPTATAPTPSASIINVRRAFVIPSIVFDVPQVAVVPGTAFVYIPADITAANGTIVNFVFYKYNFPYVGYLQWRSHISPTGPSFIPSHNLRSITPARIWQRATARLLVSIPVYIPERSLTSRSRMIKNVSQRFHRLALFPFSMYLIIVTAVYFFCKEAQHCGLGMVG
jgi:hypothetical protein